MKHKLARAREALDRINDTILTFLTIALLILTAVLVVLTVLLKNDTDTFGRHADEYAHQAQLQSTEVVKEHQAVIAQSIEVGAAPDDPSQFRWLVTLLLKNLGAAPASGVTYRLHLQGVGATNIPDWYAGLVGLVGDVHDVPSLNEARIVPDRTFPNRGRPWGIYRQYTIARLDPGSILALMATFKVSPSERAKLMDAVNRDGQAGYLKWTWPSPDALARMVPSKRRELYQTMGRVARDMYDLIDYSYVIGDVTVAVPYELGALTCDWRGPCKQ